MNPLDALPFPVYCVYPECRGGPFANGIEVDEHVSEEHLAEAVWTFATENMAHGACVMTRLTMKPRALDLPGGEV